MAPDAPPPKSTTLRRLAEWAAAIIVIGVFAGIALPSIHVQTKQGCQKESDIQMRQIAIAATAYCDEHGGAFPERLSQLYPDYLPITKIFYLTCRYASVFEPADADVDPKLIDAFSPYSLLPLEEGRAIVFERAPMWSDDTVGFRFVTRDAETTGYNPRSRLPREEFARQFSEGFKKQ